MPYLPIPRADWQLLLRLVISFLAGALIGLEREKARFTREEDADIKSQPGVRSFGFLSLLGALAAILPAYAPSPELAGLMFIALTAIPVIIVLCYVGFRTFVLKERGITTSVALGLAYALGMMAGMGFLLEAIAISIFSTFLLAAKLSIQRFIRGITYTELLSALEIGIIIFLIGPFVPRQAYDPVLHVVNFWLLYVFFVIVIVLSFLGYVVTRAVGPRALEYFSFFGGLVHSEATTVSLVSLYGGHKEMRPLVIGGIIAATVAMMIRNAVLISALAITYAGSEAPETLAYVLLSFLPSIIIGYMLAKLSFMAKHEKLGKVEIKLGSPLELKTALRAVAAFLGILLVTTLASRLLGSLGTLVTGALGGLVSAEAVIFTVFTLASSGEIGTRLAVATSLYATLTAVMNKVIFARAAGGGSELIRELSWRLCLLSAPCLLIATLLLW